MKSHRGLSSIVGAVFLIAIVVSSLSYLTYSLELMGNFSESLIAEEARFKDKQREAFEITSIDITAANKLDGIIKNSGEIPVKLASIWIDEQGVNDVVQKFILDDAISPGNTVNIIDLVDYTIDPSKGYNMKVVSSRGEINSFYINSLANENIFMQLKAAPPVIPSTFTGTLLYTVVNNMSNGNYLYNLTPIMNATKAVDSGSGTVTLSTNKMSGPLPASYPSLGPGEVAIFSYTYELTGDDNDYNIFNVTLANANPGNEAITTITVKEVPIATSSGTAVTSFSLLESNSILADVLYFHAMNAFPTNIVYPMDGASPNSAGVTESPNGNTLEFITSNMTSVTTLPIGALTASLNYYSNPVPLGLPQPSFAFFFECDTPCGGPDKVAESIGIIDGGQESVKAKDQKPDWVDPLILSDGPDSDGYYTFNDANGDEWFKDEWKVDDSALTEPRNGPDTDAIWVRIPSTADTYQPIIKYGKDESPAKDDIYEIAIVNGGQIEFRFSVDIVGGTNTDFTTCTSSSNYDDNAWHHIVAVRDADHSCKLYIDNILVDSESNSYTETNVDVKWTAIGAASEGKGDLDQQDLTADVSSWMHWGDDYLTTDQVEELFYTNYGVNGTRLYMTVERTDKNGVFIENIIPETKIELPFHDPSANSGTSTLFQFLSANTTDGKYSQANMTATSTSLTTFSILDRLKLTLDWKGEDNQNLPINIMFDDSSGWTLPDGPSYLQTPTPTPAWPSYLSFDYKDEITLVVFNDGPEGIWFTFSGTRMVLTSLDGIISYGAMPQSVNASQASPGEDNTLSPGQDSIYIPDQYFAEILFLRLGTPVSDDNNPCSACAVTSGDYETSIYLSGYDEKGETFLKTIKIGVAHITGNP